MNIPKHWHLLPIWQGYGSPFHPLTPKPDGNRCGVYTHELHAEVAEYRLRHEGETSPDLLAYIVGCGLASKRL